MIDVPDPIAARPAEVGDAAEIVRLACVMFISMGMPRPDEPWRRAASVHIARRLGVDAIGAVVDHPTEPNHLIASAVATISTRLPTPTNPTGRYGYIQWVATDDDWRYKGCARAVMTWLVAWFDDHAVSALELHATPMGERLYRSLGFWEGNGSPPLRRRTWDPAPPT